MTNETDKPVPLFYQITYTLGDKHAEDVGRLHTLFRRENPTTLKKDFELLPLRKQKGRYIGSVIGVRNLHPDQWWGEGEIKVYMDGDKDFPTICGTGSEDYVGLSWGVQQTPFLYNGCSLNQKNFVSMYRWHLADPIAWQRECRITIQQIAYEERAGGDPRRLVVRDVLVRAGAQRGPAADARREGPHGRHLEGCGAEEVTGLASAQATRRKSPALVLPERCRLGPGRARRRLQAGLGVGPAERRGPGRHSPGVVGLCSFSSSSAISSWTSCVWLTTRQSRLCTTVTAPGPPLELHDFGRTVAVTTSRSDLKLSPAATRSETG